MLSVSRLVASGQFMHSERLIKDADFPRFRVMKYKCQVWASQTLSRALLSYIFELHFELHFCLSVAHCLSFDSQFQPFYCFSTSCLTIDAAQAKSPSVMHRLMVCAHSYFALHERVECFATVCRWTSAPDFS